MRISITVVASDVQVPQDFFSLEVFPDMTVEAVKGFVKEEIGAAPSSQTFLYNQQPIANTSQTLTQLGIGENDVLGLAIRSPQSQQRRPAQATQAQPQPASESESIRQQILSNPQLLAQVRQNNQALANAVNQPDEFARQYEIIRQQNADAQREKEEQLTLLNADPFNVEAQAKIEELIRQERVMENMHKALEDNPESFGRVIMLYIDVVVNNVPIKAFVDSGAQTTIMSPDAAERCGIMRLIDRRFGGMARGVGTAKILGRVHSADIQIGQYNLVSSFTVMEGKDVDLLLGLDMLKRHQMCIDLKDNVLRVKDEAIPFLPEKDTPKALEDAMKDEAVVPGPGNTEVGAETGTVRPAGSAAQAQSSQASSDPQSRGSGIRIHPQGSVGHISNRQAQAPAQPRPAPPAQPPVNEQAVAQITDLGFSRSEALMALQQAQGNVELAIGLLL